MIPAVVLKRLYVPGSLRNRDDGFQISLRNVFVPGTITGIGQITVDGCDYTFEAIAVEMQEKSLSAVEISAANPVRFNLNDTATLVMRGEQLASGTHDITIAVITREAGEIRFQVGDTV